jgi:hypothetical protein
VDLERSATSRRPIWYRFLAVADSMDNRQARQSMGWRLDSAGLLVRGLVAFPSAQKTHTRVTSHDATRPSQLGWADA